ncbi:MAG: dihydroorotase, partial [Flavobacteriales bacterium]
MRWIIKSATIVDPNGPLNGKKRDLLIENGIVQDIKSKLPETEGASVIEGSGLCLSLGWLDLGARFCDPGGEIKEDLTSGLDAAASGGFTEVVVFPSTSPPVDQKASVEYLSRSSAVHAVKVLPAGCISHKRKGKQLAEMVDMHLAGAVAFTDDTPIDNSDLMNKALEYSKSFNGLIFSTAYNSELIEGGQMHEGLISTQLGLKGIPAISENIRVARDLELLRYTNGKMHIFGISSQRSIELIKKAKKEGLKVTASVAAHQLAYSEEDLLNFDSNLKVQPPFRSKKDR